MLIVQKRNLDTFQRLIHVSEIFPNSYITSALVVYLSSSLSSQANFGLGEQMVWLEKILFFCSISKGSLCTSYATEITHLSIPQPHCFLLKKWTLIKTNTKDLSFPQGEIDDSVWEYGGHTHALCLHRGPGVIPEYFRCVLTLEQVIDSDISISTINNLPKILPNHQQCSPPKSIVDIHLSLLHFGNSFELDKEISKISLVTLYILHYSNQSAKCLYVFIWIFPYLIITRYLWEEKK